MEGGVVMMAPPPNPQVPGSSMMRMTSPGMQRFQLHKSPMGQSPTFTPRSSPGGYQPRNRMDAPTIAGNFDGKRMRNRAALRRTVDYNASMVNYLENRIWQRDHRDRRALQTDPVYSCMMVPSLDLIDTAVNCVATRHIRTSANKIRCPIFCVCWTPEGRRLLTGASSGEFTLWNGLTFNFETILQAHDSPVRRMKWSHSDQWMLTGDHSGFVKYWQSNMNNVKMFQAHKDPIRGLSFCPTDQKFASCSDDGTVRIWDFMRYTEEKILRGHGADVKCVDWHPQKSLVASGSKDTQQPLKLWDPRTGDSLATIHAHKHTVMELSFNQNGNWLLTASRDHLVKLFDIRNMKEELQSFRGHKKEATTVAWHPVHEQLFASGGSDGSIMYWMVGTDKEVGNIDDAHENMVWSLAWHPLGHILVSGSNDHTTKFWARNKPGDHMKDRYNLNLLPQGITDDMLEMDPDLSAALPGMGLEFGLPDHLKKDESKEAEAAPVNSSIPGLDFDNASMHLRNDHDRSGRKKVPYAKPVPRDFQQAWAEGKQTISHQENGSPHKERPRDRDGPPPPQQFQNFEGGPPHPPPHNMPPQDQDMRHMPPPQQQQNFGPPGPHHGGPHGGPHGFQGGGPPHQGGGPHHPMDMEPQQKRMREEEWRGPPEEHMNGRGGGRGGFPPRGRGGYMEPMMDRGGMRGGWNRGGHMGRGGFNGPHDEGGHFEEGPPPQRGGFRGRGNRGNFSWRGPRGGRGR